MMHGPTLGRCTGEVERVVATTLFQEVHFRARPLPVQTTSRPASSDVIQTPAWSRREFVGGLALAAGAHFAPAAATPLKRVAAIVTEYVHNSHADVLASRMIHSHSMDGKGAWPPGQGWPQLKLASVYVDQKPERDTSERLAKEHGFLLASSIEQALTLGGNSLAVDGVLLIGEHGKYPLSDTGQIMYPRRRFFEETAAVFRKSGRSVPVFSDKHLAWNWADAKWMYDTARELNVPFMAGSSLPGLWRHPAVEMKLGARATEAVALSYGPLEGYGFHGLEALQCLVERRRGGESGVAAVQFMQGPEVWDEMRKGRFSQEILHAAVEARENKARFKKPFIEQVKSPAAFFIDYADGFKATMIHDAKDGHNEWIVAWGEAGRKEIPATSFWTQEARPLGHFAFLLQGIEKMIYTSRPTWPAERTLLTTGVLAAAFESRRQGGVRLATPHLAIRYEPTFTWQEPPAPMPGRPLPGM